VDLRDEGQGLTKERDALKAAGISYVLLPWKTEGSDEPSTMKVTERLFIKGVYSEQVVTLNNVDAAIRELELVDDYLDNNRAVYIHCQRGEDRSGTFISLLRDLTDSWKIEFSNYGGSLYPALKVHRINV